jgi:hypothetical protein
VAYRLYFLDAARHIRDVMELECEDDAQAIEAAEQLHDGRAMELWRRARIVKSFPASEA